MPSRELRRPDFVVGAAGVGILPGIADVERVTDDSGPHFVAEQPLQHVFVERQRVLREDRIAQLLELFHDLVIEAGIVVIGPAQHDDADPVFALQLVEHLAGALANVGLVIRQRLEADFDRAVILFQRQTQ